MRVDILASAMNNFTRAQSNTWSVTHLTGQTFPSFASKTSEMPSQTTRGSVDMDLRTTAPEKSCLQTQHSVQTKL